MWEWISAGLLIVLMWLATRYMNISNLEPVIERIEVPVQDNTQLLLLTEQLGSSQQQVKFLDATINTLSHQVAKLETDLENTQAEAKKQKGRAASAHTSKGQILEKWAPFVDHPEIDPNWEAENWSFMGNPIDYIVWDYRKDKNLNLEEGMIYIMDVKSAKAQLSTKQRRIRDLVKAGRVEWREIRLD
jgi:predicted Holliday junction resolvase-like endonuclease|tara:strand:- start:3919 stop:4482 length:564 start_codon:yes stop_codon:yes gene_type:complete